MSIRALVVDPSAPERLRLTEAPEPVAGSSQVLIDVHHVSLNHGDLNDARSGRVPPGAVLGSDAAGVVTQLAADGSGPQLGTRVVALARHRQRRRNVRLWEVASGEALGAPLPDAPHSTAIPFFTPDGTHLIAAQDNGRAYRWDIRPASLVRQACEVAGRRLARAEWDEFLPGRAYHPAC